MFRFLTIYFFALAAGFAQPAVLTLPPSVSAAGTGVIVGGNAWGYVVWQATSPDWYAKHDVAVYLKPGKADSPSPYVLQGTMAPLTDPEAIIPWVNRTQRIAKATSGLAENLSICSDNAAKLLEQWSPPGNPIVVSGLVNRLSTLVRRSKQEEGAAAALRALGLNHPIFRFVTGTGWTGPLGVPIFQDATIELREVIRATGVEGSVVARVTIRAVDSVEARIAPDLITAPGPAVQVQPNFPTFLPAPETLFPIPAPTTLPDLAPALRWSIPVELRRNILLTRGFMVWRGTNNASYATVTALLDSALPLKKILRNPAPASKIFNAIGNAVLPVDNFAADRTTWFVADDNDRFKFSVVPANNKDTVFEGSPLPPNSIVYYHVAAVDLLGRYATPATVREARPVHTLPPVVPRINRIENIVANGGQRIRLSIQPNKNLAGEIPTHRYLIFRDRIKNTALPANAESLNKAIDPARQGELVYIGNLSQPANPANEMIFLDDALVPTAPEHFGQTYFYCVRAVHDTAFGMNTSPPSPPVFGTVRDREGPPAPTGFILAEAPRAGLSLGTSLPPIFNPLSPKGSTTIRLQFDRRDPGISHIRVTITSGLPGQNELENVTERILPDLHFGSANSLVYDYPIRWSGRDTFGLSFRAVTSQGRPGRKIVLSNGMVSGLPERSINTFKIDVRSGSLMQMNPELDPIWSPFFRRFNNSSSVFAISPTFTSGGDWIATFPAAADPTRDRSLLIQAKNAFSPNWDNLSTARLPAGATQFFFNTGGILFNNQYRVWEVLDSLDDVVPSIPVFKPASGAALLRVGLVLPVGSHEYRLYRRIDNGPLLLLKQDSGTWDPATVKTTVFNDGMIPPAGGMISYFGQTFDQHGNAGPLALLDQKIGIIPELPTPVVDALESGGSTADPRMLVRATCPSPGVEAFEIKITPDQETTSTLVTKTKPNSLLFNFTPGAEPIEPQKFATTSITPGIFKVDPALPREYTNSIRIKAGVEYLFQIRVIGAFDSVGTWSSEQKFTWTPPIVGSSVPWPARPLPRVQTWSPEITAFLPGGINFHLGPSPNLSIRPNYLLSPFGGTINSFPTGGLSGFPEDNSYSHLPVAVQIGTIPLTESDSSSSTKNWTVEGVSDFRSGSAGGGQFYYFGNFGINDLPNYVNQTGPDDIFHSLLARKTKQSGDIPSFDYTRDLFPIVLYRQQLSRLIAGVSTPVVNADVVQVSPMIEKISWTSINGFAVLIDPYVRVVRRTEIGTVNPSLAMCIFDTAPVAVGATYAYHLVHFDTDGEPDLIHPCGTIFIPGIP